VRDLVSLNFFVVPTVMHKVLSIFLILAHHRWRVVHFNVTDYPTAQGTAQQVVEAFPWSEAPRYLVRDRDRIYGSFFRAASIRNESRTPTPSGHTQVLMAF
jgi:putative transposase